MIYPGSSYHFELSSESTLEEPFGYVKNVEMSTPEERVSGESLQLIHKKLWGVSVGGASQIFMMLFMMYMIGNDLSIFTILFLFNFLSTPIKGIANMPTVFAPYRNKGVSLLKYQLIYLGIQGVMTIIAGYKLSKMGMLPVSASDWLEIIPAQRQSVLVVDSTGY